MARDAGYPLTAAELARRLGVDGNVLRKILRANPHLVPGHGCAERYAISEATEAAIRRHTKVRVLLESK